MAHGTNIISAPVVMPTDIAAILGIDGTDLEILCTSAVINMWAVYKPMQVAQPNEITLAQRKAINFGIINIPTWTNINKMANFWFGVDTTSTNWPHVGIQPIYWGYQRPTTYKRLSDFSEYPLTASALGYHHGAEAPIGMSMYSEYTIDSNGHLRIIYNVGAQDSRTIKLQDLVYPYAGFDVANMYFGVVMRKAGTTNYYAVTQTTKISQISQGAYVDIYGLDPSYDGEWEIFPMASSDPITFTDQLGGYTNGKFLALQEREAVGIGATIVRMNITDQSLNSYRDTSQSTRLLYANITLVNDAFQGNLGADVKFEVFDASNNLLGQQTITSNATGGSGQMPYMSSKLVSGAIDLVSLATLRLAYSVRATVTPNYGQNIGLSYASCMVTDGPSPYA